MPWISLASRLEDLPLVIAGPILRQVTPESVTVWVVLGQKADVSLVVRDPANQQPLRGKRPTVAIGTNLHIVAVTATQQPPFAPLKEGIIYRYDMTFDLENGASLTLASATRSASLAYPPLTLPSFCLPPKDVNSLRLIHGSCRIPHGNAIDSLPMLDELIEQTASNPLARPHQLLMTGDQIYADDVAISMLVMLTDASDALLGWKEVLPFPMSHGGPNTPERTPPFVRRTILADVGLTSVDLDGHLLALGEYLCMYLFVWSDVLWKDNMLLFFDEVVAAVKKTTDATNFASFEKLAKKKQKGIESEISNLLVFRNRLKQVRRALANIPSYMIFDDHEVTDDWNMTRKICHSMYGTPLGVRMVQNALVAYALCQHWGNVPGDFVKSGATSPPGAVLLGLLDKANGVTYQANSAALARLVGVHDADTLRKQPDNPLFHDADAREYRLFHDADALTYNYTVEAPGHQVIVTDTRSWRCFPRLSAPAPDLLTPDQIQKQVVNTPATNERVLLVVLSTNVPPVQAIRTATGLAFLANRFEDVPDLYESWEMGSIAMDRLFKAISEKLPVVANNDHRGSAIFLSGDVHFSFASRLFFTGTSRFEDAPGSSHPVTAVFAQLVASSFRKQTGATVAFHRHGYDWGAGAKSIVIPPKVPEEFAGWNLLPGQSLEIGKTIVTRLGPSGDPMTLDVDRTIGRSGTVALAAFSRTSPPLITLLTTTPHWRYRLEYLEPKNESPLPLTLTPIPPIPSTATAADRKKAAEAFHVATGNYRIYDKSRSTSREVVGVNNFGEITFDWGTGNNKRVNHTLRWRDEQRSRPTFTTYTVSMDPADPIVPP
jgi:hypothetical protein